MVATDKNFVIALLTLVHYMVCTACILAMCQSQNGNNKKRKLAWNLNVVKGPFGLLVIIIKENKTKKPTNNQNKEKK